MSLVEIGKLKSNRVVNKGKNEKKRGKVVRSIQQSRNKARTVTVQSWPRFSPVFPRP